MLRSILLGTGGLAAVLAAAACSGGGAAPTSTGGEGGATASTAVTTSVATTTSVAASSPGGATSVGGTGGSGGAPTGPRLVIPKVIDLPYTVAGQGGSSIKVAISNDGDAPLTSIAWSLVGASSIQLGSAPASLAPGEKKEIVLQYAGASIEVITEASLDITSASGAMSVPVFAATGDAGLGDASWEDVIGAGGTVCGSGATVDMPAAPFPSAPSAFTDPSVRVFLPEGYRDRGAHDLVIHFHGHNATLDETLSSHFYQEQLWASGSNAVLVVPQGPVNAASGDFGKLMKPGGLSRLIEEVLILLYREGQITHPVLDGLVLTSHSGGYKAVAVNLESASMSPTPVQVNLFDSLYGYETTYQAFATAGGRLRSNYTQGGGTLSHNQTVAAYLEQHGVVVADTPTQTALRSVPAVIDFTTATHDGSTHVEGAFGERLRWSMPHSRRGPRVELREVVAEGSMAKVRWLSPPDEDMTGFVVERSSDGKIWTTAAETGAGATTASFALAAGARVRVRAKMSDVAEAEILASDAYRVDPAPMVLVVDGFDRVLDGSFGGLRHDFAAMLGEAAGPVATVSHRAIIEDGFGLSSFPTVLWLLGDESSVDRSLTPAEQQVLRNYVDAGGHLVVSASELAWELGQTTAGASFLAHCFGAKYLTDNSGSHTVAGAGALASVGSMTFAGMGTPYACPYPDALTATSGGEVLLTYSGGKAAAVGVSGRGVLVGFPIELIDSTAQRAALVAALLSFAGG